MLKESETGLKSKDLVEQLDALRSVAALKSGHENAPSPLAARFLGEALGNPSMRVRIQAVLCLLGGQHPEESLNALLEAVDDLSRLQRDIETEVVLACDAPWNGRKDKKGQNYDLILAGPEYIKTLLLALGRFTDRRAEKALIGFLDRSLSATPGIYFVAAAGGILAQRGRHGMEMLHRWESTAEKAHHSLPEFPRALAGNRLAGTSTGGGLFIAIHRLTSERHCLGVLAVLNSAAEVQGLTGMPPVELGRSVEWRGFLASQNEAFPELDTLDAPIHETLPASSFRDAILRGEEVVMAYLDSLDPAGSVPSR